LESFEPEPHRGRTRQILKNHPQVRDLVGRNPWTLAIIAAVSGSQVLVAWLLRSAEWWQILIVAYIFGAFLTHALWAMIHDCVHRRVLQGIIPNRLCGLLANLSMVVPTSCSFEKYHLRHHIYQGVYELDGDLPSTWEIKVFGNTKLGRAVWMIALPILMTFRPARMPGLRLWDRWLIVNFIVVLGFDALVWFSMGPMSMLYLGLSMLFALGFHPLGARWIQEHFTADDEQETFSYYGALNYIQINIGYHNEHHDFPGIPWNRLPALKKLAPEMYNSLASHKSWAALFLDFVMSGRLGVASRVIRTSRKPAEDTVADQALVLKL